MGSGTRSGTTEAAQCLLFRPVHHVRADDDSRGNGAHQPLPRQPAPACRPPRRPGMIPLSLYETPTATTTPARPARRAPWPLGSPPTPLPTVRGADAKCAVHAPAPHVAVRLRDELTVAG